LLQYGAALDVGEVPVGRVLVLRDPDSKTDESSGGQQDTTITTSTSSTSNQKEQQDDDLCLYQQPSVIVSHGANPVNATRDATQHAEMVAIDRMFTGGQSSDHLRLPPRVLAQSAHGRVPNESPLLNSADGAGGSCSSSASATVNGLNEAWINVPEEPKHWKNGYDWGSRKKYTADIFQICDLYVTCEPCIMVS
jgi:pyrimidine deaminase RibD-like protein